MAEAGPAPALLAPRVEAQLAPCPEPLRSRLRELLRSGELAARLAARYPEGHALRSNALLAAHVQALKQRHLRRAPPLAKVEYDPRLILDQRALGTLSTVARVQGARLKAKHEIRIAAAFKDAPAAMLQMIVVHELAHLREREHGKAFYALCESMLPGYAQLESDTRLHLLVRAHAAAGMANAAAGLAPSPAA